MFNKENKKATPKKMERNIFGKKTTITGDINSDGDFRIDGILEGNLKTDGRVIIGVDGFIKGTVNCENADIEGKFSGELSVSNTLTLKATANITGDVIVAKLAVEPGAAFNATCKMMGTVKDLNKNEQKKQVEKTA